MADASYDIVEVLKIVAAPGAVAVLGWWLRSQFAAVSTAAATALAEHEKMDVTRFDKIEEKSQERHEENLGRFETINTTLAQMNSGARRH